MVYRSCSLHTCGKFNGFPPHYSWWRHQMETIFALLALFTGNSPITGEFPSERPVTRSFDVSFDLRLNKRLSKQPRCRWFETPPRPLWRQCNISTFSQYDQQRVSIASFILFYILLFILSCLSWFIFLLSMICTRSLFTKKTPSYMYRYHIINLRQSDNRFRFVIRIITAITRCLLSE